MSRLHAARHYAVYRTPRDDPRLGALRARLDEAMRTRVPDRLARTLAIPEEDPRVVLIRRLPVRVAVRGDWSDDVIAEAWTTAIEGSLRRALEEVPEGTMVFADRAAYLKEFLIDRATGHAHDRWYYRDFQGLALLPLSAAVRTVVLEDPFVGERALIRMSSPARNSILRSLSEADAARILRGLLPRVPAEPGAHLLALALERADGSAKRDALRGYLALREALPDEPADAVGTAVLTVQAYVRAAADVKDVSLLIDAIHRGSLATLVRLTDVDTGQSLLRLRHASPAALRRAAGLAAPSVEPESRSTPHGGAFLLLESLDELPLDEWCAQWPTPDGISAAQALRWLLLIQTLGADRSYGVSHDPTLRDLLALPPSFDPRGWCRKLSPPLLRALSVRLEAWQEAKGHLSGRRVSVGGRWIDDARGLYVGGPGAGNGEPNEETRSRLKYAPSDRAYLRPDPRARIPRRVADGLAPLAAAVLRSFAWRLPGFGRAHLEHLSRNFLTCAAQLDRRGDVLHVSLSLPPLDLVLRMTRIARPGLQFAWTVPATIDLHL